MTLALGTALPLAGTLAIQNRPRPVYGGGISSLRNSWAHTFPYPFDTMSLPEVGVSVQEDTVVISINTDTSSMAWLNKTITELIGLMRLPRDWSSDCPKRIEHKAIEKIIALLLVILEPDSPPPSVVPTRRGGVQVEWHQNGIDLEIEATSSDKLEYYFSGPRGDREGTIGEDRALFLKRFTPNLKATYTRSPSM